MSLSFLLEQQEKISLYQKSLCSLEELKIQCEHIVLQNKNSFLLSKLFQNANELKQIRHDILDEDYEQLFQVKQNGLNSNHTQFDESIFAVFTSPLNENWKETMACKGDEQFAIRTGFYQNEFEIYQSILMGFQAVTIFVTGLDSYQVQYLTEVARDFFYSVFFVVHNKEDLNIVLQTDAPYILISPFEKKNFSLKTSLLYNLSQFVPKSAELFAFGTEELMKDKKNLYELGYSGCFVPVNQKSKLFNC